MAQIFTVTATGSSIAFIIRELGNPSIAGWVIQVRPHLLVTIKTVLRAVRAPY